MSKSTTPQSTTDHAAAPVLPKAKMNLVKPTEPVVGRVVGSTLCTRGKSNSFIRHVEIDVSGTPLAGNFLAGQSFGVIPPGVDERGKPHKVRLYSIACPSDGEDGQGNVVSTTPKRLVEEIRPRDCENDNDDHRLRLGVASNYLCDLCEGDEVQLSGPSGKRFLLPVEPEQHDYLFVATGTGVAPFRGMAIELLRRRQPPCSSQIHLVMGSPYMTDLLYDDLFRDLDEQHENFHYHPAISREQRPDGRRGLYVHQYIEEQMETFGALLENPRTLVYICGVIGMQVGLFHVLARHGVEQPYLTLKEPLSGQHPEKWLPDDIKRYARPTECCMVEVY